VAARHKVAAPSFDEGLQLGLELPSEVTPAAELVRAPVVAEMPSHAPQPAVAVPAPIAVGELLEYDPRLISALPLPTTLVCRRQDGGGVLVVTTSRVAYEAARAAKVPAFVGGEIDALTISAENERGTPAMCARWCELKVANHGWRLSVEIAMAGVLPDPRAPKWRLRHVLWTLGLQLIAVGCGDEVPAELAAECSQKLTAAAEHGPPKAAAGFTKPY
jgi:hypothetical protein